MFRKFWNILMTILPRELCQFSMNAISGYAWHICVKYLLLLIEWESVCELPIGQSCDWHTSPKHELDDVLATAGYMGSGCCVMWTTGHRTPSIKALKRIPELWIIITSNTPTYKLIFMVEKKDLSAHHWQAISECPINEWINASYVALSGWRYIAHCSRQRQWKLFHFPLNWYY